jgi:pyruvate dehydrogenase E1 component alpha subunit
MSIETTPRSAPLEQAELERLYAAMARIRIFEDTVHLLFLGNEIEGTTHLCQGQEAVNVGV